MEGSDRRAGRRLQGRRGAHMVVMGMGEDEAGDFLAASGGENIRYMLRIIRDGIDDADPVLAFNEISIGAVLGHDTGIARYDPADTGQDGQKDAALRFRFL